MAYPEWFLPEYYAQEKLRQMQTIEYNGQSQWTADQYERELQNFRDELGEPIPGETIEDKAYQNFLACNGANYDISMVPRSAINVAPNSFFDVGIYVYNLATYANAVKMPGMPPEGWSAESILTHLYNDLNMSAWEHYTTVGMFADINPSNLFNTRDYIEQRRVAMNNFENDDGSIGWNGKTDWTVLQVMNLLADEHKNPIMDYYTTGGTVFELEPVAPAPVEMPADWTPWIVMPPYNPYEDNVTNVEMTASQTSYTSANGVNTQFDAVWNSSVPGSTIAPGDIITGGNGHNTLSVTLNAPWPGFDGAANVTHVGRLQLLHGSTNAESPYTFDVRGISDLQRVDIEDNGKGAISVKNLGIATAQVNIAGLEPHGTGVTQPTTIEYTAGAVAATNNALEIGVENLATEAAPAPIIVDGIENLTVNALTGNNYVNLQGATGVNSLVVTGGGNVKITSVANDIHSYDASGASGRVNMAASNLTDDTVIQGGSGPDTITLTQNYAGTPKNWNRIDALAVNPGVKADINANNIAGLRALWVNSAEDVTLNNLPATNTFTVYDSFNGSSGTINVNGNIRNLNFSTADYAAQAGASSAPTVNSNVQANATIVATGSAALGGEYNFREATGKIELSVGADATLNPIKLVAPKSGGFAANLEGVVKSGSLLNVLDSGAKGSLELTAPNGIGDTTSPGQITLDSDQASSLIVATGGKFTLGSDSSLNSLQDITVQLDGNDAGFHASAIKSIPLARNIKIEGSGDIDLGEIGSQDIHESLEITATALNSFSVGSMTAGSNANIIVNVSANAGPVVFGDIEAVSSDLGAQGDVHLTITAAEVQTKAGATISGADLFLDLSQVSGNAFSAATQTTLAASESVNYIGAQGDDFVGIAQLGAKGPSSINLGTGGDALSINSNAVAVGQYAMINVDLGADTAVDSLTIGTQQAGGRLGVFIENFTESVDRLNAFSANSLTAAQAQNLLNSYGISTNIPITDQQIVNFGDGDGVLYEGDLYGFNTTSNTMVVLAGIDSGISSIYGSPIEADLAEAALLMA